MVIPSTNQLKSKAKSIYAYFAISEAAPMTSFLLQPWHLLLAALAAAVKGEQQHVIEYLRAEIYVLILI